MQKRSAETPKKQFVGRFQAQKTLKKKTSQKIPKYVYKNTPKIKCFQIIHGQVVIHVSAREQLLEVCTSMKYIQ